MKILLVSFQENSDTMGVKYVHARTREAGHDSTIVLIPRKSAENLEAATRYIVAQRPEVVGFSVMSYEFQSARDFAAQLRQKLEGPPFVFGGIHATVDPEDCLTVGDIVVRGEGEDAFLRLLDVIAAEQPERLTEVPGLVFMKDGEPVYTASPEPVEDIDSLPYPGHMPDGMLVAHAGKVRALSEPAVFKTYARYQGTFLSVLSSRGCPYSCRYCCNVLLNQLHATQTIRERSVDSMLDELKRDLKTFPNVLYVNFHDDSFLMHSQDWIEAFSESYGEEVGIPFMVKTSPKLVKEQKLIPLKKAGLRWLNMGLQTGSDRVNRDVFGRYEKAEDFIRAAGTVAALGFSPWYDVILDNPWESEDERVETINTLLRLPKPFQVDIYSLDYFPGTQLRDRAAEEGMAIPEIGEKSYTKPAPTALNRLVRMCPSLPAWIVRTLTRTRKSPLGKLALPGFYALALALEPFVYIFLIHRANDHAPLRTLRVLQAFSATAVRKLILRKQG